MVPICNSLIIRQPSVYGGAGTGTQLGGSHLAETVNQVRSKPLSPQQQGSILEFALLYSLRNTTQRASS